MIIFGTRGITYSKDKGDFHCPECGSESRYDHKRVRRFFTLYFIPLIPLNLLGEYVECGRCESTFKPEILEYDPEAAKAEIEAEYHHAVRRVMIGLMLADGRIEDEEVRTIADLYQQLTGSALSDAQVRSEASQTDPDAASITGQLKDMAPRLNDHGKEMVLRGAFLVAAADGAFQEEEMELISKLGEALDMTSAHVDGVMRSMQNAG